MMISFAARSRASSLSALASGSASARPSFFARPAFQVDQAHRLRVALATLILLLIGVTRGVAWTGTDIGAVGVAGSDAISGSAGTVTGSGADIWGTADAFRFVHQAITGDATLIVRVTGVGQTDPWAKAGLMIRENLTAGSRNAFMFTGWNNNSGFQHRSAAGGASSSLPGAWSWLSLWLKLERVGNTLTGYQSQDGVTWSQVGSISLAMSGTIYAGLAVTSHNNSASCTASFDNISLTTSGGGGNWTDADVGSVTPAGSSSQANGTFTVSGAGADIYGTADAFHFLYQSHTGDGTFVARVTAVSQTDPWAKAGIMIREDLTAGARNAFMFTGWNNNSGFQYRSTAGQSTSNVGGPWSWLSLWLKLVRTGNTITGYQSQDGNTWAQVGSISLALPSSVYVGVAVTSHNNGTLCTATLDNVTFPGGSQPPTVAMPTFSPPGGDFSSPQSVTMTAASGASIRYTTDGSTPTLSSNLYSGPITVNQTTTLKAIAIVGSAQSDVRVGTYNFGYAKADYIDLVPPNSGDETMHILSPTVLELVHISRKTSATAPIDSWDYPTTGIPAPGAFTVTVTTAQGATSPRTVTSVGFKRRTLYAPIETFDLRITNSLILKLDSAVPENATVNVSFSDGQFSAVASPLRYNPVLHVNQEGYMPNWQKKAYVGYYLGTGGELDIAPNLAFELVDMNGNSVPNSGGTLQPRNEKLDNGNPTWYNQKVAEANFTSFNTPGIYRLKVAGMGVSLPFKIDPGIAMAFTRTYALGLYHQRCGDALTMPYTRFTHDACHTSPAFVPMPEAAFRGGGFWVWNKIEQYALNEPDDANLHQTAPDLVNSTVLKMPFFRQGTVPAHGGHHDAGDYNKYIPNSADFVHYLVFAVDSLNGSYRNLGTPKDPDPNVNNPADLLIAAKWEADFLARMIDTETNTPGEGGAYYLVYPRYGEYDAGPPNNGLEQVVWPKQSGSTASAVAALAQIGSSPAFIAAYGQTAASAYLQKAERGWNYLVSKLPNGQYGEAIPQFGNDKTRPSEAFQKMQHFGKEFADLDDIVWAACQLYLATGDKTYENRMKQLYQPSATNGATMIHGYKYMPKSYGNAVRSYVFALQSGRLQPNTASSPDPTYMAALVAEAYRAADQVYAWSTRSAYGLCFPDQNKSAPYAGWYMGSSWAFDAAVGHALATYRGDTSKPLQGYLETIISTMDFEAGNNPANAATVTGLGLKRQKVMVHQYSSADHRFLPMSGIPIGTVRQLTVFRTAFHPDNWLTYYESDQNSVAYPSESGQNYALYDRWSDNWNVQAEFTHLDGARAVASLGYLASLVGGTAATAPWTPVAGSINGLPSSVTAGTPVTVTFQPPAGMTLDDSVRIVWETVGGQAGYGPSFKFTPTASGTLPWIEAEAMWPDGRRVFAVVNNIPEVYFETTSGTATVGGANAVLTLRRTNTSGPLSVGIKYSGNTVGNVDFTQVNTVHFANGAATATLNVQALANSSNTHNPRYVRVTLEIWQHEQEYRIKNPSGATVILAP